MSATGTSAPEGTCPPDVPELALQAVRLGAELALEFYHRRDTLEYVGKEEPGKLPAANLVSAADLAVERVVRNAVLDSRPGDGFLGEEGSDRAAAPGGLTWVLDPIDGTLNFAYGRPEFAVSLAVLDAHATVCAAVAQPCTGEIYLAVRGAGARLDGVQLSVRPTDNLSHAVIELGAGRGETRTRLGRVIDALGPDVRDLRRSGCAALSICAVASGRADAYYGPDLRPWDRLAALLVATEAGARTGNLTGDLPDDAMTLVCAPSIFESFRSRCAAALANATEVTP